MKEPIAIVGMACRYPDATSPAELWENVLARRQAFRRIPDVRMRLDDYWSDDATSADRTYSGQAAVLTGYHFDRNAFRIPRETYESSDLAHWLALDMAAAAISDARFDPPRPATGVIVGNTLTGDGSRANAMRLRWPFVRNVVATALGAEGWGEERSRAFLDRVEAAFKAPFAPVTADTLAGSLSNTIAGRICNYFGFRGGGYTIDGACASSLLAVAQACTALETRSLDVAIAGGVDLSLDPFELVGFARCTALARDTMRVFDRRSSGFLPGEGCGFVVLMRRSDAEREKLRVYANIAGWGISSDGHGGMTRPEIEGQKLAIGRAVEKARISAGEIRLFEAHGTGTPTGDAVEIATLLSLLPPDDSPHYVGSIKANIGHTKAAAGIAGLLKAVVAVHRGVIPPTTGCDDPREDIASPQSPLRVSGRAREWNEATRRAGVSAFGFGGINTHVIVEHDGAAAGLSARERQMVASHQDAEVFLFGAMTDDALLRSVAAARDRARDLSLAEMADLASELRRHVVARDVRLAIVASTPRELEVRAAAALRDGGPGVFRGAGALKGSVALLFSGQGSPVRASGHEWSARFPDLGIDDLYARAAAAVGGTGTAQPSIVASSIAALRVLKRLGITADCAVGHSLGEITALAWAGAFTDEQVLTLAAERGSLMQALEPNGTMLAVATDSDTARRLARNTATIAAINAPEQTVLSGRREVLEEISIRARASGIGASFVPVELAFHSDVMAPVAAPIAALVRDLRPGSVARRVISTVTGAPLAPDCDLSALLALQVTAPVRFADAISSLGSDVALVIEAGPGSLLCDLARRSSTAAVFTCDAGSVSLVPLMECFAAAYAAGCEVDIDALFAGRFTRRYDMSAFPRFLENPCERFSIRSGAETSFDFAQPQTTEAAGESVEALLLRRVADHTGLPSGVISTSSRLLSDLHLSSITVGRILGEVARAVGAPPFPDPTRFANATIAEAAASIDRIRSAAPAEEPLIAGVADWVRPFVVVEKPVAIRDRHSEDESSWIVLGNAPDVLRERFARTTGRGVLVAIRRGDGDVVESLLASSRALATGMRLVVAQEQATGGGFARSVFLERGDVSVRVVNVESLETAAGAIAAEAEAEGTFAEATYRAGERLEPRVELMPDHDGKPSLARGDRLLVTGGGKGIAAEAALGLARAFGVRLLLMGRSDESSDRELQMNLARMRAEPIDVRYVRADVTDADGVARALAGAGPIDAILHAAGNNEPASLRSLEPATVRRTIAPKVSGLRNVVAACGERLRFVIAFGSVIARCGMRGEAHYALANELLALELENLVRVRPSVAVLCIEWSAWSNVGMAERLERTEALRQQGVVPIDPESAVRLTVKLIQQGARGRVIASARLGDPPTLSFAGSAPLLRFLERPRVFYGGVEIVADAELSSRNDPYLEDHVFQGEPLLPALVGVEAMAQAATALAGSPPVRATALEFARPVIVSGSAHVRIAAVREGDLVDVVLRSSDTGHRADHFRASFHYGEAAAASEALQIADAVRTDVHPDAVYRSLLFHGPRFRRIVAYRALSSSECVAEVEVRPERWFHRYLPQRLVLGDPAVRDAAVHALQACVPQATVLPVAIASIEFVAPLPMERVVIAAREIRRENDWFEWDLDLASADGAVAERWRGLRLQVVARRTSFDDLPAELWGPLLEREMGADAPRVAVARAGTQELVRRLTSMELLHGPNGQPRLPVRETYISAAHGDGYTLAIADAHPAGCDLEAITGDALRALEGGVAWPLVELVERETSESPAVAATRVWSAAEAVKKASAAAGPLVLVASAGGRVSFTTGRFRIDTFVIARHVVAIAVHTKRAVVRTVSSLSGDAVRLKS